MNMMARVERRCELKYQAGVARELGSSFVASVLEAGQRQIDHAPRTADLIANWPNDPSAAALAMRFNAALNAIARRGSQSDLTSLYNGEHDDFDAAIAATLTREDGFIAEWMRYTPQTNEIGRAAAIVTALMAMRRVFDAPFELLELGSSCGLNLNLARYAYELGGVSAGDDNSPIRIRPEWRGPAPVYAPVEVVSARGVDLNPLDAGDDATRERLLSFVWADQPQRARRLEQALAMAQSHPPRVDKGNAADWLASRLTTPQEAGVCRVVFHSMVFQYLGTRDRYAIMRSIRQAGHAATCERPLAWITFEWTPKRSEVQLLLTRWPDQHTQLLARCHAYGDWIEVIDRPWQRT